MGILEKLKELYNKNKYKQDKRDEDARKRRQKDLTKTVNHFLDCAKWAAKNGYSGYKESRYDYLYCDSTLEEADKILKDEHGLNLRFTLYNVYVKGWA